MKNFLRNWGFFTAGILFIIAGIIPISEGRTMSTTFFVIGIAFLVIGTSIRRKNNRGDTPPVR